MLFACLDANNPFFGTTEKGGNEYNFGDRAVIANCRRPLVLRRCLSAGLPFSVGGLNCVKIYFLYSPDYNTAFLTCQFKLCELHKKFVFYVTGHWVLECFRHLSVQNDR